MKVLVCLENLRLKRLKSLVPLFLVLSFLVGACKDQRKEPEYKSVPIEEMVSNSYLKNIDMTRLVSLTDSICGMSLKDGVSDTLIVDSLIYGFCSEGCKRKFTANLNLR